MVTNIRTLTVFSTAFWLSCLSCGAVTDNDSLPETRKDTLAVITGMAAQGDAAAQNTLGLWYYTGQNVEKNFRTAFEWWGKSAAQGNADAIGNMGLCYQLGNGTSRDSVMAITLYMNAVKKGNEDILPQHETIANNTGDLFSCRLLYECYENGVGVKRDEEKAGVYLEKLAEGGDAGMQFSLGLKYLNSKRASDAVKWFKLSADNGDMPAAVYYYGYLTFKGMGVTQDKEKGTALMQEAADRGFAAAHRELGLIYYNGDGVEQDYAAAVGHLKKAASTSNEAAWTLGQCYLNGNGVAQDYYFATQWFAEFARSHEKELNSLIFDEKGDYYNYIMGLKNYYVDKNYDTAIKFFKKVKNAEGLTMLGVCQANKNYKKRNTKKAAKTFAKAEKKGSVAACYYLSLLYESGEGVAKGSGKAFDLLVKAADGGVAYAQCKLGDKYFTGEMTPRDYSMAVKYYLSAEAQNRLTPASAGNLIKCYERQISALPDLNNAEKRIQVLKGVKENNKVVQLLKAIKE